jgi:hypothetical protein
MCTLQLDPFLQAPSATALDLEEQEHKSEVLNGRKKTTTLAPEKLGVECDGGGSKKTNGGRMHVVAHFRLCRLWVACIYP